LPAGTAHQDPDIRPALANLRHYRRQPITTSNTQSYRHNQRSCDTEVQMRMMAMGLVGNGYPTSALLDGLVTIGPVWRPD
jgi:hypothetical protein